MTLPSFKITAPPTGGGSGGRTRAKAKFVPLHEDVVASLADRFAQQTIGRAYTGEELASFIDLYRNLERQAFDANQGRGGEHIPAEALPALAGNELAQDNADVAREAHQTATADVMDVIGKALGGS